MSQCPHRPTTLKRQQELQITRIKNHGTPSDYHQQSSRAESRTHTQSQRRLITPGKPLYAVYHSSRRPNADSELPNLFSSAQSPVRGIHAVWIASHSAHPQPHTTESSFERARTSILDRRRVRRTLSGDIAAIRATAASVLGYTMNRSRRYEPPQPIQCCERTT